MAFKVGHTREAANTSTGNQAFTITWSDGGSYTPQAALFVITTATADATAVDGLVLGVGAAESTTKRWAVCGASEHNISPTNANNYSTDANCIAVLTGAGALDGLADFVSFGSNTVTVNWTDAPASAYLVYIMAYAGAGAVDVGIFDPATATAGTVDVTALGTSASVVIGANTSRTQVWTETPTTHYQAGLSLYTFDGTTALNHYYYKTERDAQASALVNTEFSTGNFGLDSAHNPGSATGSIALSNHASGFTVTTTTATTFSTTQFGYLALSLPAGIVAKVGTFSTKTTTGSQGYTDPGFTPQALLLLGSLSNSTTDLEEVISPDADGFFIGGAVSASSEFSMNVEAQDGIATADTQSRSDSSVVYLTTAGGTGTVIADLTSLDATGFTLNYSATNGTARTFMYLAFETDAAAGGDLITKISTVAYSGVVKVAGIAKATIKKIMGVATQ
jgi:hypothetical protein